ncbi:glycosyltransferase [Polaribacter irgensii]|nr:glycosyltransferase [Polaribacter irgensii]
MNLLFIYTSEIIPQEGGVQRVTKVLSDYFKSQSINVFYISQHKKSKPSKELSSHYFLPDSNLSTIENINFLKNIVSNKEIDVIINQAALGGYMASFCDKAKLVRNVKIISVIHNSLLGNVENLSTSNKKIFNKVPLSAFSFLLDTVFFKIFLLGVYKLKYKLKYLNLYNLSDKVVLLSDNYFKELKFFVKKADKNKVISIANPCTIQSPLDTELAYKENELLYVGRINTSQKRVDLLLDIWDKTHKSFPNWRLTIVGDGEELISLKHLSKKMNLERIHFLGHKDPTPYYTTAKILCMTSSFEGLPLVLAEAHNFNVIPILFDSFPSATDIIKEGKNGFLIKPFDLDAYAVQLGKLMTDYNNLSPSLNEQCAISAKKFSLDRIGNKWLNLFEDLKGNRS